MQTITFRIDKQNFSTEKKLMDLENRRMVAKGKGEGDGLGIWD